MSKEAVGQNGALLGSPDYWDRLNRSTYIGTAMQRTSEPEYFEAVKRIGQRAASAIDAIYADLQKSKETIRNISFSDRNTLSHQVQALSDVCSLSATSPGHSMECLLLLHQSDFSNNSFSWFDESAVQSAIHQIKNNPDFFASECLSIVRKAADWGIESAADNDKRKAKFLEGVSQRKGRDFLRHVLEVYQDEQDTTVPVGSNGAAIGSGDYLQRMERDVFLNDLSMMYSARFGTPGYTALLRDSLDSIAHTMEQDLLRNERENNYITDETASILKRAGQDLSRCGVTVSIDSTVDKLAWFVGGNPAKIRQLQSKLNELHLGEHLTEDGVYGKKTEQAVGGFFDELFRGSFHTLTWVNPLQSESTGIVSEPIVKNGETIFALRDYSARSTTGKGTVVFRPDTSHNGFPYTHINTVEGRSIKSGQYVPSSEFQLGNLNSINHKEISEDAYHVLKDLDGTAKKVRTAGRVLLVAGAALEALELYQTIESDLNDADQKIGKKTYSHVASIVGSWSLSAFLSAKGAAAGAAIGTAIMPGAGTAIGGVVGSVTLGLVGSFSGSALGKWIVDITVTE